MDEDGTLDEEQLDHGSQPPSDVDDLSQLSENTESKGVPLVRGRPAKHTGFTYDNYN